MRNNAKGLETHVKRQGCTRLWQACAKVVTTYRQDCTTHSQPCKSIKLNPQWILTLECEVTYTNLKTCIAGKVS